MSRAALPETVRFVIEGLAFHSITQIHKAACERGFNGGEAVIRQRIKRGPLVWSYLARKIDKAKAGQIAKMRAKSHADAFAAARAVDARKAVLLAQARAQTNDEGEIA